MHGRRPFRIRRVSGLKQPAAARAAAALWALVALSMAMSPLAAQAENRSAGGPAEDKGELYLPSEDAMADVDGALARAAASQRLALIVLGANWCHDSRALAARLHQEPLAGLVANHYETLLVDVGFLEHGQNIVQRFGSPIYYATPTVLIVDPDSEELVNAGDRHQWGNAFSISMEDSVAYFERMAEASRGRGDRATGGELERLHHEIDAFEQRMARRVEEGYAVVGPMLRAYKAGQEDEQFDARWNEVSQFRLAIPGTVGKLRQEAARRVAVGEQAIELEYPDFPPFSWQSGAQ